MTLTETEMAAMKLVDCPLGCANLAGVTMSEGWNS